jgi:regulator of CtrA degradation
VLYSLPPFPRAPACGIEAAMQTLEARTRMTSKLIDSLYVEAMVLADEARSYFDRNGREERLALDPIARVGFSCESLKVTTRLMQVIAWLLTQRAVEAGEISPAQARTQARRLGEAAESDPSAIEKLPTGAASLVQASQELYARVRRLDEGSGQVEPQTSPARTLLSRLERSF